MKKRTRSAIGRQNRAKGAAFEREVVAALLPLYPDARRNLSQTRTARREGPDILGTPWWLELTCGRVSESVIATKWRQSIKDRGGDLRHTIVIYKPTRGEIWCSMGAGTLGVHDGWGEVRIRFETWCEILSARAAQRCLVEAAPVAVTSLAPLLAPRWGDVTEAT